jgi:hypothetical protein
MAAGQTPDGKASGLLSLLPFPLWGAAPHDRHFEHPVTLLAASRPHVATTWMLDRTLEERSPSSLDRIRVQGTQETLDLVYPLISGPDSLSLGHIAVKFERADRWLTFPVSSSGRLLRHHLDYRYGQVTYAKTAGPRWRFGGSAGVTAQPDDRRLSYTLQGVYERPGVFQISLTAGRRTFRQSLDLDLEKREGRTLYRFDVPPSEQRLAVAAAFQWTAGLSWGVEGTWRTIQSAARATGPEGRFRLPMALKQGAVKTGPTLQLFSGGVRFWLHGQGERYDGEATLLREEREDRAGRLQGAGRRWGWETGLFSVVSRRAGLTVHAAGHRMTWDASGYFAPQQIVDLPLLFDWFIDEGLERRFYRTTLHLGVRGFGVVYARKVMAGGLLHVGAHRASIHLDGNLLDWSYPGTGPVRTQDRRVVMRPKILNTLFLEARYPLWTVTLHYRLTRLIPQQGRAPGVDGWHPVDTPVLDNRQLKTGSLHVVSLSYAL